MTLPRSVILVMCCLLALISPALAQGQAGGRIQLTIDTSEADQVLAILALEQAGKPIPETEWQKLFATAPYQRLKQREQKIGEQFHDLSGVITDEDFKKFVLSADLVQRAPLLRETLERWKQADLRHSAEHVLAYLPDEAVIHAKVYPIIKPGINSFVWELSTDPTIFLYLNPEISQAKFENTVDHELHHIGLGSLGPVYDKKIAALPARAKSAADEMGAFGEGFAMLAAAGGPDIDPHAASTAKEHALWDSELAGFNTDLPAINSFFLDILSGKLADDDAIGAKGSTFYGNHQGPWYTVGYKMAVIVEKRYGRAALIQTMTDYRCLLVLYNRAAAELNAAGKDQLPLWSESVLSGVGAGSCGIPSKTGGN
ncbi:MAG TPA: DUF5700 domain-containing putative Zn-dependent protease [Candidatus Acidoferrum sp.]|nr:DUF5700 domain-containing putative Zn-dependent protease [Candidatus Acidoferrum sp.]